MSLRLFAMTCGSITMSFGRLREGEQGLIKIPVPVYLIDHHKGLALFDSGLERHDLFDESSVPVIPDAMRHEVLLRRSGIQKAEFLDPVSAPHRSRFGAHGMTWAK